MAMRIVDAHDHILPELETSSTIEEFGIAITFAKPEKTRMLIPHSSFSV